MCGNTATNPTSNADGLSKLAGIEPRGYGSFKIGDRVSGRSRRDNPSSEITGVIQSFGDTSGNGVAVLRHENGTHSSVWNSTLEHKPAAREFKVGDYVSGSDRSDGSNRKSGTIEKIDADQAYLRLDDHHGWYVITKSLQPAEKPGASGSSGSVAVVDEVAAAPAVPAATQYPVTGSVDFNKPLTASDDDYTMENIKVVAYVPAANYPFVVSFSDGINTLVHLFDEDGDNQDDGDYNIRNAAELPTQVFGRLMRDDNDDLFWDEEVYTTEAAARAGYIDPDHTVVTVFPVETKPGASAAVPVSADNDDNDDGDEEGKAGLSEIQLYFSGQTRTVRPGYQIFAVRRGFGQRSMKVVKIRSHRTKALLLQPSDGNSRYWAINNNLRAY